MDAAVEGEDEQLSRGIFAEAGDVQLRLPADFDQLTVDDGLAVLRAEAPDPAGVVVAVDVDADQFGQRLATVDVTPGDALAVVAAAGVLQVRAVGILDQWPGD